MLRSRSACVLASLLAACGGDGATGDTMGVTDGGSGRPDAAPAVPDGPIDLAIACDDTPRDVYVTPGGLPGYSPELRGAIVRCTFDGAATVADVQARMDAAGVVGVTATSAVRTYRVAYRTEREPGIAGVGTAKLILPDAPMSGRVPVVVAAHGTAGLADACAPSRYPTGGDDLVLPWAAVGYPVIAPDYAGLGNEGVEGYGHQADTSHSVLDAARAVKAAVDPAFLSTEAVVAGHSQGGGAAQAAQALSARYLAPDFEVLHAVSFAGALPGQSSLLAFAVPDLPITGGAGVTRTVLALGQYATAYKIFGPDRAGEVLHPALRDYVTGAIETQCVYQLTTTLGTPAPGFSPPSTLAELVDPAFATEVVDCVRGTCTDRASAYDAFVEGNTVPIDESTAKILLLGGGLDAQQPPARQACTRDALEAAGVPYQVCQFADKTHFDIVPSSIGFAIEWVRDDTTPCPGSATLPDCAQLAP